MGKTRELPCIFYICKGECELGKDAEFYGLCQTCPEYMKRSGSRPARTNTKKRKIEEAKRRDEKFYNEENY